VEGLSKKDRHLLSCISKKDKKKNANVYYSLNSLNCVLVSGVKFLGIVQQKFYICWCLSMRLTKV
jgi:hypothetical protein